MCVFETSLPVILRPTPQVRKSGLLSNNMISNRISWEQQDKMVSYDSKSHLYITLICWHEVFVFQAVKLLKKKGTCFLFNFVSQQTHSLYLVSFILRFWSMFYLVSQKNASTVYSCNGWIAHNPMAELKFSTKFKKIQSSNSFLLGPKQTWAQPDLYLERVFFKRDRI